MPITDIEGTFQEFTYSGKIEEFIIPQDGLYMLEVWGAKGGDYGSYSGGNGGYSIGYKLFTKGTILHIVTGGAGLYYSQGAGQDGGYNGGGSAHNTSYNSYPASTGGGATHIATKTGLLSALESYISDIIIVAGGGGGAAGNVSGGGGNGGYGGGDNGGTGCQDTFGSVVGGGTQTAGGGFVSGTLINVLRGSFGKGGNGSGPYSGGGGGGFYGGAGGQQSGSGGGGSGYTGGVPSIIVNGTTYSPSMTNGSNSGSGRARITYIKSNGIYNVYHNNSIQIKNVTLNGAAVNEIKVNNVTVFK